MLKKKKYIRSGFITGISEIYTTELSKLNNLTSYKFLLNKLFVVFYRLTDDEINDLKGLFQLRKENLSSYKNKIIPQENISAKLDSCHCYTTALDNNLAHL